MKKVSQRFARLLGYLKVLLSQKPIVPLGILQVSGSYAAKHSSHDGILGGCIQSSPDIQSMVHLPLFAIIFARDLPPKLPNCRQIDYRLNAGDTK